MYSQPINLRYGQVYNEMQSGKPWDSHKLPSEVIERYASGKFGMAITSFSLDMVRKNSDGTESPVLLSDHYLHHYILYFGTGAAMRMLADSAENDDHLMHMLTSCHGMNGGGLRMWQEHMLKMGADAAQVQSGVSFGSASGAEFRHNPQRFEAPYRFVIHRPEYWLPTFHIINTKGDNRTVSPLLECPCTPQRKIDPSKGTIDGHTPEPPFGCSRKFAATGNPSCDLSTYVGGWRCCEHNVFLIDTDKECSDPRCSDRPKDKVFMKYTFHYEDESSATRALQPSACCDVSADKNDVGDGNIEHDVPVCPAGTPPEKCIFEAESLQPVGYWDAHAHHAMHYKASDLVDLAFAAPHLHWAGISLELIDPATNKTICEVHKSPDGRGGVMYGTGQEAGNEDGYLVGLRPCVWGEGDSPTFRRDHLLRIRTVYNASSYHTGVMSLWLMQVAPSKQVAPGIVV